MNNAAVILARGGSKGIPKKNIIDFCGKPLLAWTIEQCRDGGFDSIYVSSDSDKILEVSEKYGAVSIKRAAEISGDTATSESGWLHALEVIEEQNTNLDWILAPQVTSPLRSPDDIRNGFEIAKSGRFDSLFSCSIAEDLFFWEESDGNLDSVNYDWRDRKRRQEIRKQYIENGSFYLFRPEVLRENNNRFGGRIGVVEMDFWKMFEIDSMDDLRMCSALMKDFIIEGKK
jgi:CMP-N,N'-diacetyllegionaminic acid synthase